MCHVLSAIHPRNLGGREFSHVGASKSPLSQQRQHCPQGLRHVSLLCPLNCCVPAISYYFQVTAPVRETAAQALALALIPLSALVVTHIIGLLAQLQKQPEWDVR